VPRWHLLYVLTKQTIYDREERSDTTPTTMRFRGAVFRALTLVAAPTVMRFRRTVFRRLTLIAAPSTMRIRRTVFRRLTLAAFLLWTRLFPSSFDFGERLRPPFGAQAAPDDDQRQGDDAGYDLRWASSGGGWRAMTSNMGFANAFAKAGLINETSCAFRGISANSGGAWFMVLLLAAIFRTGDCQ